MEVGTEILRKGQGAWETGVLGRGSQALLTVLKLNNVLESVGSKKLRQRSHSLFISAIECSLMHSLKAVRNPYAMQLWLISI